MDKVLIADDHSLFSSGLSSILNSTKDFKVVGMVENGRDVIHHVITKDPDVLILDLNLPKKNGIDVLREVKAYKQSLRVYIVTMYNDTTFIRKARELGAEGYFLKSSQEEEIINAIKSASEEFYITTEVSNNVDLEEAFVTSEDDFSTLVKLTSREKEILKLIVEGLSSKEIAVDLDISSATVDTHRKNMLKKLSFNKISELVSYAYRNNLV